MIRAILAVAVGLFFAGSAAAEPLILRCVGGSVSVNVYDLNPTTTQTQRFYRIDQQQFSRLEPSDVLWPANFCVKKSAKCTIADDAFVVKWRDGFRDASVQINRKSGRVVDEAEGGGFSSSFIGDCSPSADPTGSGGPAKF